MLTVRLVFSLLYQTLPRPIIVSIRVSYKPREVLNPIRTDTYASWDVLYCRAAWLSALCITDERARSGLNNSGWWNTHSSAPLWWSLASPRFQQRLPRASRSWSRRRCRSWAPFARQGRAGTKPRRKKTRRSKETLAERIGILRRSVSSIHSWI